MLAEDIRTVAGARAIPANSGFYNAYVDSWIYDKNSDISGAKVSYAECIPETDRLPEWNSKIEVTMSPYRKDENGESAVYSFPRGCEIDESVEVNNINGYNNLKQHLDIDMDDNRISFSDTAWTGGARAEVVLLVRYESVYSRVVLEVQKFM